MAKYRKKPVVIDAFQWIEGDPHPPCFEYCNCGENEGCSECGKPFIQTLEGRHTVSSGDYIITGVKGERYPCKPDIFEMTYEAA